jgi:hypothetical protein
MALFSLTRGYVLPQVMIRQTPCRLVNHVMQMLRVRVIG